MMMKGMEAAMSTKGIPKKHSKPGADNMANRVDTMAARASQGLLRTGSLVIQEPTWWLQRVKLSVMYKK